MSVWDITIDDVVAGPEFSTRVLSVCKNNGLETMGQVRDALKSGALKRFKQFGRKSEREVVEAVRHYERMENPTLFENPEQLRYILEDRLSSIQSLLQDVERTMLRAALKGAVSQDSKRDARLKLASAASYIEELPNHPVGE